MEVQRQMEEKLTNGLRDLEERRINSHGPTMTRVPQVGGWMEPMEGITRLRAQVAELLSARETPQDIESIRPKKARCRRTERIRFHVGLDRRSRFHFEGNRERCPMIRILYGWRGMGIGESNARECPEHPS